MADPFTGEIRAFAFTFPPANWSQCNGQQVLIQQNNTLYAVIGNTYGGDLQNYYNLPNMMGCIPIAYGSGLGLTTHVAGAKGGSDTVALTSANFPAHNHLVNVKNPNISNAGYVSTPTGTTYLSRPNNMLLYSTTAVTQGGPTLAANTVGTVGSAAIAPRANDQPYLVVNFCICQFGEFPSRQ
ncbi:tail fiber protein [Nitrospirillum amazonense]|uniref:phage tail protein n=1 Tax=Nitrospirillum amazonense TaxID=28077 RepID=UPI002DD42754|nr:tail fiber protein [Nitrospirillum amazonense]MEC4592197.1 tail fiber protein [Nitrospirillum amazonense]